MKYHHKVVASFEVEDAVAQIQSAVDKIWLDGELRNLYYSMKSEIANNPNQLAMHWFNGAVRSLQVLNASGYQEFDTLLYWFGEFGSRNFLRILDEDLA